MEEEKKDPLALVITIAVIVVLICTTVMGYAFYQIGTGVSADIHKSGNPVVIGVVSGVSASLITAVEIITIAIITGS